MNFSEAQPIVGFSVLDLFGPGKGDGPRTETVLAKIFPGTNGTGTLLDTKTIVSTLKNDTLGYQSLTFAAIAGVWSIIFNTTTPANSDFALASVVTPIPGAALLFGSALAGLGWMRRRRAQSEGMLSPVCTPISYSAYCDERARAGWCLAHCFSGRAQGPSCNGHGDWHVVRFETMRILL